MVIDTTTHSRTNTKVINAKERKCWYMVEWFVKEAGKNCKYKLKNNDLNANLQVYTATFPPLTLIYETLL